MKEIKITKEDQRLFRELTKSEHATARMHTNENEQIIRQHEHVWRKITKKYKLDKEKHYVYDSTLKEISEYEGKRDPKNEVVDLVWESILKDLKRHRGAVDLTPLGIDMVK